MKFKLSRLLRPRKRSASAGSEKSIKRIYRGVPPQPAQLSLEDLEALEESAAALEQMMEDELLAETMEVAARPEAEQFVYARPRRAVSMTPQELVDDVEGAVGAISEAFAISAERARQLLDDSEAHWDPLRLLDVVGAQDDFVDRLHSEEPQGATFELVEVGDGKYECPVCAEHVARDEMLSCRGGHYGCVSCWTSHIETVLRDGKYQFHCMYPQCRSTPLDNCEKHEDAAIEARLSEVALSLRNHFRARAIARARGAISCPNDRCERYLFLARHAREDALPWLRPVVCACGQDVCVGCGLAGHAPLSCKMMELWRLRTERAADETIVLTTRRCPNVACSVPIEKNGGCPHMFCVSCKVHFCWTCMWHSEPNGSYSHVCRGVAQLQDPRPELDPVSFAKLAVTIEKSTDAMARRERVANLRQHANLLFDSYRVETGSEWDTDNHYMNGLETIRRAHKLVAYGIVAEHLCQNKRLVSLIQFATADVNKAADLAESHLRTRCVMPVSLPAFHSFKDVIVQLERHMEALCRTLAAISSGEYKLYVANVPIKKGKSAVYAAAMEEPFPLDELDKLARKPLLHTSILNYEQSQQAGSASGTPHPQVRFIDDDQVSVYSDAWSITSASDSDDDEGVPPPPPPPPPMPPAQRPQLPHEVLSGMSVERRMRLGAARKQLAASYPMLDAMLRERAQVAVM